MSPAGLTHNIYLISSIDNPLLAGNVFDDVATKFNVSCITLKSSDQLRQNMSMVADIVKSIQSLNIAVLIEGSVELARDVEADGVHLDSSESSKSDFDAARSVLGNQAIVGMEIGASRHDAMMFAEQGADYIAFSNRIAGDGDKGSETMLDMISWWSELFEIPCVAFTVTDAVSVQECLRSGADFIAIDLDELSDGRASDAKLVELFSAIDEVTAIA